VHCSLLQCTILTLASCHQRIKTIEVVIIRPHRSTTCVDVAYCCRPSSKVCVCRLVSQSVCLSVILMSPAKLAEAIDMLFVRAKAMPDNTLP